MFTAEEFAGEFREAVLRCVAFLASLIPTGMIFGAFAVAAGLSGAESLAMSGLVYSGAAQFAGLELLASGAALFTVVLVTLLLSLRFLLYGVALVDDVRAMPAWLKFILAFTLVDATFFIVKARFAEGISEGRKRAFFLSCTLLIYASWLVGTALGVMVGDRIASAGQGLGLDFLAYAVFGALLAQGLRGRGGAAAVALTVVGMILFRDLPYNLSLPVSCGIAVLMVMIGRRLMHRSARGRRT